MVYAKFKRFPTPGYLAMGGEDSKQLCWRFIVQYSNLNVSRLNGILEYYPSQQLARVLSMEGDTVYEQQPMVASWLAPGGEGHLGTTKVRIIKAKNDAHDITPPSSAARLAALAERSALKKVDKDPNPPQKVQYRETLYTADKNKKAKRWNDGYMHLNEKGLAVFYNDQHRAMHRKQFNLVDDLESGTMLETASYLIELCEQIDGAPPRPEQEEDHSAKMVKRDTPEHTPKRLEQAVGKGNFEIMYTTDIVRKAKRWKDGHMTWTNGEAKFYDEGKRCIHRRRIPAGDLVEGQETKSGGYIFQIGTPLDDPPDLTQPQPGKENEGEQPSSAAPPQYRRKFKGSPSYRLKNATEAYSTPDAQEESLERSLAKSSDMPLEKPSIKSSEGSVKPRSSKTLLESLISSLS